MAPIPGWAYAVVGVAIAVYAKYVQSRSPDASALMGIFFWIGIALLAIGAFKLILKFITGKREELRGGREDGNGRPEQARPGYARDHIVCARCNAKLHPRSRYCNWCGTRQ